MGFSNSSLITTATSPSPRFTHFHLCAEVPQVSCLFLLEQDDGVGRNSEIVLANLSAPFHFQLGNRAKRGCDLPSVPQ